MTEPCEGFTDVAEIKVMGCERANAWACWRIEGAKMIFHHHVIRNGAEILTTPPPAPAAIRLTPRSWREVLLQALQTTGLDRPLNALTNWLATRFKKV